MFHDSNPALELEYELASNLAPEPSPDPDEEDDELELQRQDPEPEPAPAQDPHPPPTSPLPKPTPNPPRSMPKSSLATRLSPTAKDAILRSRIAKRFKLPLF
ncbi:hypothetical protein POTOM_023609 [Populus tomentosa]|uniref:Uncharacterized protein n=1 Tax=Populus tomentosa TaxID=118781 RepID=A0A8X8A066_POPTO|nr:hypothetical protein POTOM_023609 [Populus tomentosa]